MIYYIVCTMKLGEPENEFLGEAFRRYRYPCGAKRFHSRKSAEKYASFVLPRHLKKSQYTICELTEKGDILPCP
jgi:hypothetical protein